MRSSPYVARAAAATTAMLLKTQKPVPSARSAWWPATGIWHACCKFAESLLNIIRVKSCRMHDAEVTAGTSPRVDAGLHSLESYSSKI